MPFIKVHMLPGRTPEVKAELIHGMTNVVVDVLGSDPDRVGIILDEIDPQDWGRGGVPQGDPPAPPNGLETSL